jgi:hypothetical protein
MAANQIWRDAAGRLTFSMGGAPAGSYQRMCEAVAATFKLVRQAGLVTNGFDIVFQDYRRNEQVVGLEWDNWMGYMVVAKTPDSAFMVQEIATWLLQSSWASE